MRGYDNVVFQQETTMEPPDPYKLLMQLQELKERLIALAHENAQLRIERDIAEARVASLLPKGTPEQEEEWRQLMAGPLHSFEEVLAEVDRIVGGK